MILSLWKKIKEILTNFLESLKSEEGDEGFDEDEEDEVGEEDDLNIKSNEQINISDEIA